MIKKTCYLLEKIGTCDFELSPDDQDLKENNVDTIQHKCNFF